MFFYGSFRHSELFLHTGIFLEPDGDPGSTSSTDDPKTDEPKNDEPKNDEPKKQLTPEEVREEARKAVAEALAGKKEEKTDEKTKKPDENIEKIVEAVVAKITDKKEEPNKKKDENPNKELIDLINQQNEKIEQLNKTFTESKEKELLRHKQEQLLKSFPQDAKDHAEIVKDMSKEAFDAYCKKHGASAEKQIGDHTINYNPQQKNELVVDSFFTGGQ